MNEGKSMKYEGKRRNGESNINVTKFYANSGVDADGIHLFIDMRRHTNKGFNGCSRNE